MRCRLIESSKTPSYKVEKAVSMRKRPKRMKYPGYSAERWMPVALATSNGVVPRWRKCQRSYAVSAAVLGGFIALLLPMVVGLRSRWD